MSIVHAPVLLNESIDLLITDKSGSYFDATLGFGGHSEAILQKLDSKGKLIATDVDENAFNYCKEKFKDDKRVSLYKFNFSMVDVIAKIESLQAFDGILARSRSLLPFNWMIRIQVLHFVQKHCLTLEWIKAKNKLPLM